MKILMLIDELDFGGAETHLCSLCAALKEQGHTVIVASEGGKTVKILEKVGITHRFLSSYNPSFPYLFQKSNHSYKTVSMSLNRLFKIIKEEKPDIIHAHTRKTAFIADIVYKSLKIPLVTTAHAMFSMSGYKWVLSRWGCGTIAVSEDIAEHISKHSLIKPKKLQVIRNGVFEQKQKNKAPNSVPSDF